MATADLVRLAHLDEATTTALLRVLTDAEAAAAAASAAAGSAASAAATATAAVSTTTELNALLNALPTADPLVTGAFWLNSGVVTKSAGPA